MSDAEAEIPKIIKPADGVYVRQEIDNITWIDMGEYVLVVDALERPELEGEVFAAIEETMGGRPVRHVLNTHSHYDHVALNDAFGRRWGSEIVCHATSPLPPEGRWFEGSRRRALMLPMPGCHTDEDCIVHLPDDRILLTGDIFGWGLIPLTTNLRRETADLLLATYQRMIDLDPAVVIPGHGPLCGVAELRRWVAYFHWLCEQVRRACAAGKTDAEIISAVAPPQDMRHWWRFLKWKYADCVAKVLKAFRKGWLT
jgi:glyoxylase-like metal-dependent hydrolase (beta-lactamase superfamily II)